MLNINLLLVIISVTPGVIVQYHDYDLLSIDRLERKFARKRNPHRGRWEHGPPDFAYYPGSSDFVHDSDEYPRPPGFPHKHDGHRDHRRGHGHHRGPPFNHEHRRSPYFDSSSEEDYDYKDFTTKRPMQSTTRTTSESKPQQVTTRSTTTSRPTTTTKDYNDSIDIRFGKRIKRSTKSSNPSATEILRKLNALRHYPDWNTPHPNYKPNLFYPRLISCTEKTSECLSAYECKILKRNSNFGPESGFCKWVHDEPYVCCEKPQEKLQNYEFKCGNRKRKGTEHSQAIIGGVNVEGDTSYPWMVAIGETVENKTTDWYCGGALIAEKTVITAAHCVSKRHADIIRIGEIDLTIAKGNAPNLQEIKVLETLVHPLYRSPLFYNDIALLYLDKHVEFTSFARPICLPQKTSISSTPVALLTGWGQLSFATERSSILKEVAVKVFNNSYCDQQYSITQASRRNFPRGILDTQLCAGDEHGGKDACQGDSGAPLVTEEDGLFVILGVVSAGIGCGSKNFPGVYTRISAFIPWIVDNVK